MAKLTVRERFHAVMRREPGVRTLLWEFGYWAGAVDRWYGEDLKRTPVSPPPGLPEGTGIFGDGLSFPNNPGMCRYRDIDVHNALGFDDGLVNIPIIWSHCPPFVEQVLEEDSTTRLVINSDGVKLREKKASNSLPLFLDWPVHDEPSWEKVKEERFGLDNIMDRFPPRWDQIASTYRADREYPLGLVLVGFFSMPRELLGVTNQLTTYYDNPRLMHDINNQLASVWLAGLEEVFSKVELDFVYFWEDMCFRSGPHLSPSMFREFLTPYYRRITDFLRQRGVHIIFTDTDGDCWKLIPEFLNAGVPGLYPFEVNSNMDIVEVRKKFPQLLIQGGLDKIKISQGKEAIEHEIDTKLPPLLSQGGYIPYIDHLVPPDISWDNFCFYREKVRHYVESCQPA